MEGFYAQMSFTRFTSCTYTYIVLLRVDKLMWWYWTLPRKMLRWLILPLLLLGAASHKLVRLGGHVQMTSSQFLWFLTPLPLYSKEITQPPPPIVRNWLTPLPLSTDVICKWPLTHMQYWQLTLTMHNGYKSVGEKMSCRRCRHLILGN